MSISLFIEIAEKVEFIEISGFPDRLVTVTLISGRISKSLGIMTWVRWQRYLEMSSEQKKQAVAVIGW